MRTLPEQLLLISIDNRGTPRDPRSALGHGLAGTALTELLLAGRLRHDDGRVVAAAAGPTGEPLLAEVVAEVRGEQRPRTLTWWVKRLASRHHGCKPVRDRLIDQLTERGVLAPASGECSVWYRWSPTGCRYHHRRAGTGCRR